MKDIDYTILSGEDFSSKMLLERFPGAKIIDTIDDQIKELSSIMDVKSISREFMNSHHGKTNWVWYGWAKTLVHILAEEDFLTVRTARNKYLIDLDEQNKFYSGKVAIAGLSVGNGIATTIALTGGAKDMYLADFDSFSLSNFNRLRSSLVSLGQKKTDITLRQVLEINPYGEIKIFDTGVQEENITEFVQGRDLIIDEVDSLPTKLLLRARAREERIPLLMLTDNDDGVLVDYYPYQSDLHVPYFYGLDDQEALKLLDRNLSKKEMVAISSKIVGSDYISSKMQFSLAQVGETLVSWPQLGTAATLAGAVGAFLTRRILVGDLKPFGRFQVTPNKIF